jgi:E3 ubiquitin-protein ligase SHPRH
LFVIFLLDLFGLLCFIGFDPYCYQEWWKRWLYEPYLHGIKEPMYRELAKVMWRNNMKDVQDQVEEKGKGRSA